MWEALPIVGSLVLRSQILLHVQSLYILKSLLALVQATGMTNAWLIKKGLRGMSELAMIVPVFLWNLDQVQLPHQLIITCRYSIQLQVLSKVHQQKETMHLFLCQQQHPQVSYRKKILLLCAIYVFIVFVAHFPQFHLTIAIS